MLKRNYAALFFVLEKNRASNAKPNKINSLGSGTET